MKRHASLYLAGLAVFVSLTGVHADDGKQLSPERLDMIDQLGYFTPSFKQAVRDYVSAKQTLAATNAEQDKMAKAMPALKKEDEQEVAVGVSLRQELARYAHPEEIDFVTLDARMKDSSAKPEDQLALAQAYVWTYPTSPHASDASTYLQSVQKKIADASQAAKDSETAREAAHAVLVKRAKAHDLSLAEWRSFLRDMSQDDLIKLIGRPSLIASDDWTYLGEYTFNAETNRKVGLEITFDAGRVINVDEKPSPP